MQNQQKDKKASKIPKEMPSNIVSQSLLIIQPFCR